MLLSNEQKYNIQNLYAIKLPGVTSEHLYNYNIFNVVIVLERLWKR